MSMKAATVNIDDEEVVTRIKCNPLYKFRSFSEWSLRIVAAKCGCSPTTVSKWEDGSSYPTDENMIKIAEVMKCSPDDLKILWRAWYDLKPVKDEQTNGDKKEGV